MNIEKFLFLILIAGLLASTLTLVCIVIFRYARQMKVQNDNPVQRSVQIITPDEIIEEINEWQLLNHITYMAETIGIRREGSQGEAAAVKYVAAEFQRYGYAPTVDDVPLPNGSTSHNVYASLAGASDETIVLGAHLDSKSPSPGANDNASGVAVVLELARLFQRTKYRPSYTLMFVCFGAEEMIDRNRDHHHFGSRHLARQWLSNRPLHSMTSIDMVGVGQHLYIEGFGDSPVVWRDRLAAKARGSGITPIIGMSKPYSDHDAFATPDLPVAYVHWEKDNEYHKRSDMVDRIDPALLSLTTQVLVRAIIEEPALDTQTSHTSN